MTKTKPKNSDFTQKMSLHLNGGSEFSSLGYDIYYQGKPTDIIRSVGTNGRPGYKKTRDVFICGEEEFDVLVRGKEGLLEWLEARVNPTRESE